MLIPEFLMASMSMALARSSTYGPTKSCSRHSPCATAFLNGTRRTPEVSASSALARFSIQPVTSVPAGPPWGGLYLMPPSSGGLWDGVMTSPSARPETRPRL
ncbi:hypothetical protein DSECCO2_470270 [anaerobic digester metagenome]